VQNENVTGKTLSSPSLSLSLSRSVALALSLFLARALGAQGTAATRACIVPNTRRVLIDFSKVRPKGDCVCLRGLCVFKEIECV